MSRGVKPHHPARVESEVDADVVQVQAALDTGSILHLAPPLIDISTGTVSLSLHRGPTKALPSMGKVGDMQAELLAEHRQRK